MLELEKADNEILIVCRSESITMSQVSMHHLLQVWLPTSIPSHTRRITNRAQRLLRGFTGKSIGTRRPDFC